MVESNWSVLKRHFLFPYNMPRIDFLIYIFDKKVIPKFYVEYRLIYDGLKMPHWFKRFTAVWKSSMKAFSKGLYQVDTKNFICPCPSCMRSQFFICRHTVKNDSCPHYRSLSNYRRFLFIQINYSSFSTKVNVDNKFLQQDEHDKSPGSTPQTLFPQERDFTQISNHKEYDNMRKNLLECFEWYGSHVQELSGSFAGNKQVEYIYKSLFSRLDQNRANITQALCQRSQPKTWEIETYSFVYKVKIAIHLKAATVLPPISFPSLTKLSMFLLKHLHAFQPSPPPSTCVRHDVRTWHVPTFHRLNRNTSVSFRNYILSITCNKLQTALLPLTVNNFPKVVQYPLKLHQNQSPKRPSILPFLCNPATFTGCQTSSRLKTKSPSSPCEID